MKIAQALYEKHKLITYPRTDSRFLSSDMVGQLPKIFSAISRNYQGILQKGNVKNRISSRFINGLILKAFLLVLRQLFQEFITKMSTPVLRKYSVLPECLRHYYSFMMNLWITQKLIKILS